jgi:hypothetical protein
MFTRNTVRGSRFTVHIYNSTMIYLFQVVMANYNRFRNRIGFGSTRLIPNLNTLDDGFVALMAGLWKRLFSRTSPILGVAM